MIIMKVPKFIPSVSVSVHYKLRQSVILFIAHYGFDDPYNY